MTSHNPNDLNPFSFPVFSTFRPHLVCSSISSISSILWRRDVGREEESGSEVWMKSVDGVDEKSVDDHSD